MLDQLTFSTERKFMATLVDSPLIGKKVLYVKGAPEIVLGKCRDVLLDGKRWMLWNIVLLWRPSY